MTTFDKEKKEYYSRISSYDIDIKVNFNNFDKGHNISRIVLNPTTQAEMDFGDSFFLLLEDISKRKEKQYHFYSEYDEDSNAFIRYFSDYVSKVLRNEPLERQLFFVNFGKNNEINIDANGNLLSKFQEGKIEQSDFDYYAKILYDMTPAIQVGDILLSALRRNGINIECNNREIELNNRELFKNILTQSINNANAQVKKIQIEDVDINVFIGFLTNLFNSFHHLSEEKMKLERKK